MKKTIFCSICLASLLYANETEQFRLGEIDISDNIELQNSVEFYSEDFALHSHEDISESLESASGVFLSNLGGRNESTISIRGFDSRRVSVYMDGIPISVPYDGNFDYSRFLTADLSKISIEKGFSSVTYGANTMAGVINLVSKRPTKEFEGNISMGITYDDDWSRSAHTTSVNLGTKQENFYLQLSGSMRDRHHFNVSKDFNTTSQQDNDQRANSSSSDIKGSIKLGITPTDNSEYALVYSKQHGKKEQPHVTDLKYSRDKYWDWPYWDRESIYFLSNHQFDNSYLKTRLYKDWYENSLQSYDDDTYSTQTRNSSFDSNYDDYSVGGSVEFGTKFDSNEIKTSVTYKKDVHRAYDNGNIDEEYEDETFSLAVEDIYNISDDLNLVAGVSYDRLKPQELWDSNTAPVEMGSSESSLNPQVGLFYDIDKQQKTSFTVARKTHLPTMKERYSRRLGRALPNSDLEAEKATHYELSYANRLTPNFHFKTNLFLIDVDDAIESVTVGALEQNQNVGDFRHTGFELEASYYLDQAEFGGNYTYMKIKNKQDSDFKRMGIPKHSAFAYFKYNFMDNLAYYANATYQTGQYSQNDDVYFKTEAFTRVDTKLMFDYKDVSFEAGVKNLFDKDYEFDAGFPEPGREFFANLKYTF